MTFQEFIDKWSGKYLEYAGSAGAVNQCVDLVNQYIVSVQGKSPILNTNAKDFLTRADTSVYDVIPYSFPQVLRNGDIVVWGEEIGKNGHIAVVIDADEYNFRSFDQNYPVGTPCHKQNHSYNGVIGVMRLKGSSSPQPPENEELKNGLLTNFNFSGDKLPNGRRLQADTYITEDDKKKMWLDVGPNQYWFVGDTDSINFFMSLYRQYRDELAKLGYSFQSNGDLIPPTDNSSAIKEEAVKQANRAKEAIDSIIALFSKITRK